MNLVLVWSSFKLCDICIADKQKIDISGVDVKILVLVQTLANDLLIYKFYIPAFLKPTLHTKLMRNNELFPSPP